MHKIIKEFNQTGPCVIDLDILTKSWDHRFCLSQWGDEYRIVQYLRRGSDRIKLKCTISNEQACEIIKTLKLVEEKSGIFNSGSTWRKEGQSELDMQRQPVKKDSVYPSEDLSM